jgi:cysteine synthase B
VAVTDIALQSSKIASSILDLIGNTPIVDISELSPNPKASIFIKLEGQNPGGSIKDRVALSMIETAEREGLLTRGSTLIEPSSGNTGIGMALICRVKGYKLKVVMPPNVSKERRELLEIWGAEIIDSPDGEGSNGAVKLARKIASDHPDWVFLYQYANQANPKAHFENTGPEILRDLPNITHFVAGLGTSGTLIGVGSYLKQEKPEVQIWAVEPPAGEVVDGLRSLDDGYIPPIFIENNGPLLLDRKTVVGPRDSIIWTKKLAEVGIFAGISTGAALSGAIKCANSIDTGVILIISPDAGWKYLSSEIWTLSIDEAVERTKSTIYF